MLAVLVAVSVHLAREEVSLKATMQEKVSYFYASARTHIK